MALALLPHVAVPSLAMATTTTVPGSSSPSFSHRLTRGLLDRVRHNDRAGTTAARSARPFFVGSSPNPVGLVLPRAAQEFSKFPGVFSVTDDGVRLVDRNEWLRDGHNESDTEEGLVAKRSAAVREVLETLRDQDSVPALKGWRDEAFAVRESFHAPPVLIVERAAAVLLGVPSYGVFVNGFTCESGETGGGAVPTHVWIGTRSATKPTWPGRWDSLAAGGLGAGALPTQAMLNECCEEAGIEPSYASQHLRAVSAVSYTGFNDDGWGLKRDVLYCFDLEVSPGFLPRPVDGEMQSFEKVPIDGLVEMLAEPITQADDSDNRWKPNVGVVLIDFLVRHGRVNADDPSFLELVGALRGARCA